MLKIEFTNLRVFIDESTHYIYKDLTDKAVDKAEDVPFVKMPDLFLAAACVGAKENSYKELKSKRDIFVADAFDSKIQIPILVSLAMKKWDIDIINDPKKILTTCECYANGGIAIIYETMKVGQGLRPLYRLADFISSKENLL
ncbi:MAG TPA: hypothetical protein DIW44_07570 [Anaerolineaceae bacterium]|nr:hypothetical protein [Anaerolineaceae bacterium]